ncbi:MAG: PAS domain-containing protein [Bacteroidota bacterium]
MEERYNILIIEDDEFTFMAYRRMFSSWKKQTNLVWCKTISHAKQEIKKVSFDAAVLDYQLPDGDAFSVMPLIKETPIIFVSGMEDISIAVEAMRQGAFDYLVKDFNNEFVEALPLIIEKAVRNYRIESQLRKTEQRYSDLFMHSNDLIQSVNTEGRFLYVNPAWLSVMEYTLEEVDDLHFLDIIQPEEHEHCRHVFESLMQGKSFKNEEIGFLTKSGKRIFVEGNIFTNNYPSVSTIGIFRDITQRKVSGLKLVEAKARYDLAVDAGKTGVMDWNLVTGKLFIDDKLKNLLGFKPDELENSLENWGKQIHPDHREKSVNDLRGYVKGVIPKYEFEYKMLHKNGSVRWLLARGKAIRNGNNRVIRMIGTGTDVTLQKDIQAKLEMREEQLKSINDNLESLVSNRTKRLSKANEYLEKEIERRKLTELALEKEKTQRVSALIDGQEMERKRLAKELHDSLGQLLTAAKLQVRQTVKRTKDVSVLTKVEYTGEILDLTIQEVRRISQALMPVLLNDFGLAIALEKMIGQFNSGATAKIDYKHLGGSDGRLTKEIEIALYRICQEALNNSLKYSNCSYIQILLEESDLLVNLTISDNGDGISQNILNKIYNNPNGSGIYNMKERAELINGEFTLNAKEGDGTRIEIIVPL